MWKKGGQHTIASSGGSSSSAALTIERAIIARWLISAPFGMPVVPEV